MKKLILLLFCLAFYSCNSNNDSIVETATTTNADVINFEDGLGKSTTEYISNWNKLVSEISSDQNTVNFFSINPANVKWASEQNDLLYYQFGNSNNTLASFSINLYVSEGLVYSVDFFSPTLNNEVASQQSKLFMLIVIAMADDSLDKDGRESVFTKLGLYEEISSPLQINSNLYLNNVHYVIEPLIDSGRLIGIDFFTSLVD